MKIKRVISFLLVFAMVLSFSACTDSDKEANTSGTIVKPGNQDTDTKLTILFNKTDKNYYQLKYLEKYIKQFEENYGVEIEIELLGSGEASDKGLESYRSDLAAKLYLNEGPELIFVEHHFQIKEFVSQDAFANLKNNVKNMDKIYKGLLGEGSIFAPIGISYGARRVNRKILEELGAEMPSINWTRQQYYELFDQWNTKYKYFTSEEYNYLVERYTDNYKIYEINNKKLFVDEKDYISAINAIRNEILSGRFDMPKGYKYENYYNMFYEYASEEYKQMLSIKHSDEYRDHSIVQFTGRNILMASEEPSKDFVYLPDFSDDKFALLHAFGFLVNKKGKNLNLAYEFINGLLDKEFQMSMYNAEQEGTGFSMYPVNKELEEEIRQFELDSKFKETAINLKEHALQDIKDERIKLYCFSYYGKEQEIKLMLEKAITKFVFSNMPFTEDEVKKDLKDLINKANIYLSE